MKEFFFKPLSIILEILFIICSLFYLITFKRFGSFESYILYLLMSFSLTLLCISLYRFIINIWNNITSKNKYLKKYKSDYKFRYKISLIVSLILNTIYAVFKFITGIYFKSIWFVMFSFYYIFLVIVKTNIIKQELSVDKKLEDEYSKYRNTAIILLFLNVILTSLILIIVNQKIINIYPNWIAISVSVYTFCLIFSSIYGLIKYRKYNSPLINSSKVINVITSLVSLISLEMILIPTFGENNIEFFEIMIMSTGGIIAIIIVVIALFMIIKSTEWLKKYDKLK